MDRGAWQVMVHGVTESDMNERQSTHTHRATLYNGFRMSYSAPAFLGRG